MTEAPFAILLQITTPSTATEPAPDLSLLELLFAGGVIMIPIVLLLFIATYIAIERYLYIKKAAKPNKALIPQLEKLLKDGDVKSARVYAAAEPTAVGKVIQVGLDHVGRPVRDIEAFMESAATIEVAEMEKHMGYLGIIAGVAPMLGFIGTISGIIHIFYNISLSDNISIGIIAGGLYEKMITSGAGLTVGVLAYSSYHYLQQLVNATVLRIQKDVLTFMNSIAR